MPFRRPVRLPSQAHPRLFRQFLDGVLRSSRRTIRARCRLPPPNHALLHRATRNFRCSFRPGPGAQAETLYLPFPELRLRHALHAVRWLLAPEQADRPSYPIARDLLLCQVHADFFRQMVRHERPYLSPAPVGAAPRERGRGHELRIVGEEAHHSGGLPAPPGVFEGKRREELLGPVLTVGHQVLDKARIAVRFRSGAEGSWEARARQFDHAHHDLLVLAVACEEPLLQQLVDLFDGMELLVEGEVAGELVTPVRYLDYRPRLGLELLGVYLDHPDLVRPLVGQLPERGVLREEAVPVGPPSPGRTERKRFGMAAEARIVSGVILSWRLLKVLNSPESTSTAPTSSMG